MTDTAKILVVDDQPSNIKLLRVKLSKEGYDVVEAANGREALARVVSDAPDLVLLDVMMPDVDGPATLRALRRRESAADSPAVFITAKVQALDMDEYKRLGVFDVIVKPFDPMELSNRIGQIWQQYRSDGHDDAG